MPLLANGLLGEGLNEPPNSQGCNQCGIITYTYDGEGCINVEQNSHKWEYAAILFKTVVMDGSITNETEARGTNTTITTPTPDASMTPRATSIGKSFGG